MKKSITKSIVFTAFLILFVLSNLTVSGASSLKVTVNGKSEDIGTATVGKTVYVDIAALSQILNLNVTQNNNSINISNKNEDVIPEIIKEISPSVVGIIGNTKAKEGSAEGLALGTGVVIKSGGEILTNAHVVVDMTRIVVVLSDGSGYDARIKYIDKKADLAVIKIDKIGLFPAKFGEASDIIIGKTAIAIGTPLSFQNRNSASVGVISGLNRSIDGFYEYKLIQTDVAINPGNSGGPLVNMAGEVIGINSITTLNAQGLNYAIPIDTIQFVLDHFYKYGMVKRVTLGAEYDEDNVALYGLPSKKGLKVISIKAGSCAEKYGLEKNDYIYNVNGKAVNTTVDLNEALKGLLPGNKVNINIRRDGNEQSIIVVLDELQI
ncbi:S1C family serine protease [Ruminiclostridium cellobioparum]|uniref:S1C family serine protease n=1 Tax=Ruminiclostridium cellobioparum TaxID=29355 RepID=UPI0028B10CB2|nr:trypsin-like peptidase domain-containing protein [Ruminiclostridium cellobioparum]